MSNTISTPKTPRTSILKQTRVIFFLKKIVFLKKLKNSFFKNKRINYSLRLVTLLQKQINRYKVRQTKVCLYSGRYRSVNTDFMLKRHILRDFLTVNDLPNIKKR